MSWNWVVNHPAECVLVIWATVGVIAAGIWYEIDDDPDLDEIIIACGFWPLWLVVGVGLCVLWCLSWIGRGPGKLVKHLLNRHDIPEARVVNE